MITVNEYTNRTLLITESTEEPTNFQIASKVKNKPEIKTHFGKVELYFTSESVRDSRQIEGKA